MKFTYTTGFYLGEDDKENLGTSSYVRNYAFVGVVENHDLEKQELEVKARNYFAVGDKLEIIDPEVDEIRKIKISKMRKTDGENISEAHNNYEVIIPYNNSIRVSKHSILRRRLV